MKQIKLNFAFPNTKIKEKKKKKHSDFESIICSFMLFQKVSFEISNSIANLTELCWQVQGLHHVDNVLLEDSLKKYWGKTPGYASPWQGQPMDQGLPIAVAMDSRVCSRHCPMYTSFDSTWIASLVCQRKQGQTYLSGKIKMTLNTYSTQTGQVRHSWKVCTCNKLPLHSGHLLAL